ncbi:ParB/Srx family N-terminal domain-containing protein [Candidatus Magnetaquicoccus inordinatus]|uniref:ParB/Srx family N-terminal domain-containing protein n=1 Tax=Candidatus Magnetaquicoccus inordinatus TaxID=2496818 RepID=UPI00102AE18E|nr:ParB/Srx family N-terminal domain-containing protein [Candidatus Magnetaquicoccus inordinatus]
MNNIVKTTAKFSAYMALALVANMPANGLADKSVLDDMNKCRPEEKTGIKIARLAIDDKPMTLDDTCKISLDDLHPTQYSVGMNEVQNKKLELLSDIEQKKDIWKKVKNFVPVVRGPDNKVYITDHHHLVTAIYHIKQDSNNISNDIPVYFIEDYYNMLDNKDDCRFWSSMKATNKVWLKNNQGIDIQPSELPKQIKGLQDDPMRSLAAMVEDNCGFLKCGKKECETKIGKEKFQKSCATDPYFLEFKWADFIRNDGKIQQLMNNGCALPNNNQCLTTYHNEKLCCALPEAMQYVASEKAQKEMGAALGQHNYPIEETKTEKKKDCK